MASGRKESWLMLILVLLVFLLWAYQPSVKVSRKTTAQYTFLDSRRMQWQSGTGLEILVTRAGDRNDLGEHEKMIRCGAVDRLIKENFVFLVEARIDAKINPVIWEIAATDEARLTDDRGNTYRPRNGIMAADCKSARSLLLSFENPFTNNAPFAARDTRVRGMLVFKKTDPGARQIRLEIPRVSNGASVDFESCFFNFTL